MQHSWHLPRVFHTHCTKVTLNNLLVTKSLVNWLAPHQPKWRLQCQGMTLHGKADIPYCSMGSAPLGFPNGDSIAEDKSSSCLFMSLLLPESQWMANNSVGKAPERSTNGRHQWKPWMGDLWHKLGEVSPQGGNLPLASEDGLWVSKQWTWRQYLINWKILHL